MQSWLRRAFERQRFVYLVGKDMLDKFVKLE
jgi:hypothetical protein